MQNSKNKNKKREKLNIDGRLVGWSVWRSADSELCKQYNGQRAIGTLVRF